MNELTSCPDGGHCQNEYLIEDLLARAEAAEARVAELESTISAIENILNKPNQKPKKDYQDSFDNAIYRLNIKLFFPQSEVGE